MSSLRFRHWTYQITNKYLIVTDLQGFNRSDKEYLLTDPAITSALGLLRFTNTNLGIDGEKHFFESHQCNLICKHLKLEKHEKQKKPDIISCGTKLLT